MSFMCAIITAKNDTSTRDWYRLVAHMHREFDRLQDAGVHGYYTMSGPQLGSSGSLLKCNVAKGTADSLLAGLKRLLDSESGIASSSDEPVDSFLVRPPKMLPAFESVSTQHN
jgi:hypothetical protein